jgi:hypothetical protein
MISRIIISNNNISSDWLTWFIGFVEGDGTLYTSSDKSVVRFIITQKERTVLDHIQETLQMGYVIKDYKLNCHRYLVVRKDEIRILTTIFNGNLILNHRRVQLNNWLLALNVIAKPHNLIPTLQDAWLSGFIDAEGCFNVTLKPRKAMKLGYQVLLRFILDQKSELDTLLIIKNLWGLMLIPRKLKDHKVGDPITMHRIETRAYIKMASIISYLTKYPLRTNKQYAFTKWLSVYDLMSNDVHLTQEGLNQIRDISKNINTFFDLNTNIENNDVDTDIITSVLPGRPPQGGSIDNNNQS